jgi:hypothetical protein
MDYYLKTTSQLDFTEDMLRAGYVIEINNNYFQDDAIIVDWIGEIPNPIEYDENGEIIGEMTYRDGEYVNVRSVGVVDTSVFVYTFSVYPEIPYREFS